MGKGRSKAAEETPADEPAPAPTVAEATGHDAPTERNLPAPTCVALCRVHYGVPDVTGASVTFEYAPGEDVPEEHAAGMVEGVHYEKR